MNKSPRPRTLSCLRKLKRMRIIHVDDKTSPPTGFSYLVRCAHIPSKARYKRLGSPLDQMGLPSPATGYSAHARLLVEM
ncbi:hypothetical protein L3X38_028158 [Prunus dulcis]|uniref:Uncharacterized protein n=1 Tax=Prunus dulcis TaxID=3755 RepID=A0AAD4Z0Y2_PRUDU|nr:hypothetical protein L3X38_028158 [Prunus dulcis]